MSKIIDSVKYMSGYEMGKDNLTILCYADDAVLIVNNEDNIQRLLYRFIKMAERYNIPVSTEKRKPLLISKEPIRSKLRINSKVIEQVMSFLYLEVKVFSRRNSYK
ncbi:hypothetical protein Trydic_g8707 [Trypoxylus dichotomus]